MIADCMCSTVTVFVALGIGSSARAPRLAVFEAKRVWAVYFEFSCLQGIVRPCKSDIGRRRKGEIMLNMLIDRQGPARELASFQSVHRARSFPCSLCRLPWPESSGVLDHLMQSQSSLGLGLGSGELVIASSCIKHSHQTQTYATRSEDAEGALLYGDEVVV